MKSSTFLATVILFFVCSNSFAQVTGGRSNSDATPSVAQPSTISSGGFSGDVNLFSGAYSASIPLGATSTPGGLSFNLSLEYSSNYNVGATPPITTGIPYGEGWNLNLPTISIETEVFNNFSFQQYCDENQTNAGPQLNFNNQGADAKKEGDLYWYSPYINIPGIASGRAIFKYVDVADNKSAVFELNSFENHVEVRFNSEGWRVITSDGTIYHFVTAIQSYNAPANKRVFYYNPLNLQTADNEADDVINSGYGPNQAQEVSNSISPKTRYNLWYCDMITNKNVPLQSINFVYEKFGAFNYFKEYTQDAYKYAASTVLGNSTLVNANDFVAYTDIFLKQVESFTTSGLYQLMKMNYKTDKQIIATNPLELVSLQQSPSTERLDSLYTAKTIFIQGNADQAFTNWRKYQHIKASPLTNSSLIQGSNPYLTINNDYVRSTISNSSEIPFDHSFLESPRIGNDTYTLVPGDIYEIKTRINRENASSMHMGNSTLDIAVVTGDNENVVSNNGGDFTQFDGNNGDYYSQVKYNKTRGIPLFSTFNMALKWTMSYQEGVKETSNLFVMPNVPTSFDGINIQIGPGNSDVSVAESPGAPTNSLITGNSNNPDTKAVYFANLIQSNPPKSMADMPGVFGIGLPWAMMVPVYKQMISSLSPLIGGGDPNDAFKFWWKDLNSNLPFNNEPTKLDASVKLDEVELVRYAKNPYMLTSVQTFYVNGVVGGPENLGPGNSGLKLVAQKELTYKTQRTDVLENYAYNNNDPLLYKSTLKQVRILLSAVKEVPIVPESDTSKILTTFLGYKQVKYLGAGANNFNASLPINGYTGVVLERFVDHLGGVTRVDYYPIEDARTNYSRTMMFYRHCGATGTRPSYGLGTAFTVHPVVKHIIKNDEQDLAIFNYQLGNLEHKKWTYDFDASYKVAKPNQLFIDTLNFHNGRHKSADVGFKRVSVYGPSLLQNGQVFVNKTVYEHYGVPGSSNGYDNTLEEAYLLHGKLKSIKEYDVNNVLYSEKLINYAYTLAYIHGFNRPNPYRENLIWDQMNDYPGNEYEYQDFYLDQVLTKNVGGTVYTGPQAYSFLDIPVFNGTGQLNELPRFLEFDFYNALSTKNPTFMMNSYFIKKTEEIDRVYDRYLSKPVTPAVPTVPAAPGFATNPFGPGIINNVAFNEEEHAALIEVIQNESSKDATDAVIAASPVPDVVLNEVLVSPTILSQDAKNVLLQQPGISDYVWSVIFQNDKRFKPDDLINLLNAQPYFSDDVLSFFSQNVNDTWDEKVVETILLKNPYLTNTFLLEITDNKYTGINAGNLIKVLSKQPQMSEAVLSNCIANTNIMRTSPESIFENQVLSGQNFSDLFANPELDNAQIAKVLSVAKSYPSESQFNMILTREPAFSESEMTSIVSVANRQLEQWIIDELIRMYPRANFVRLAVFRGNPLNQYCNNQVEEDWSYIETKKSFEYYEADYQGRAIGRAYKVLMGLEDIPNRTVSLDQVFGSGGTKNVTELYLKHEPSWQVFSVSQTSVHLPDAKSEEQYFYLYDLKNRYDRYWYNYDVNSVGGQLTTFDFKIFGEDTLMYTTKWDGGYASASTNSVAEFETPRYDGMVKSSQYGLRSIPFQKTVITKSQRNESAIARSEYYMYDSRWKFDNFSSQISREYPGPSCPSGGTPPPPPPPSDCETCVYEKFATEATLLQTLPWNHCLWEDPTIGYYICPTGIDYALCHPGATLVACKPEVLEPESAVQKSMITNDILKKALQLRKVIVQLDTVPRVLNNDFSSKRFDRSNEYVADFYMDYDGLDAENFIHPYRMIFPYDTLTTSWVRKRNEHMQPALIEDASGLRTRFYYAGSKDVWYTNPNCTNSNYSFQYNFSATESFDIGLPVRVTVGFGRADSLATTYEYNDARMVKKVTAPSTKTMEYFFDGYNRLISVLENGTRTLTTNSYNVWNHNITLPFAAKTDQNYVTTEVFSNATDKEIQRAFLDPLGRTAGMAVEYQSGASVNRIYSGKQTYDNWGRSYQTHKTTAQSAVGAFTLSSNAGSLLAQTTLLENTPRSTPVRAADFGVDISSNQTVKTNTCITNHVFASCELELNNFELQTIMRSGNISNFRFVRTEVFDQDDKRSITYTNAMGQTIATLNWSEWSEKLVTLFIYDNAGNLKMTINPKKQATEYEFNILGQKIREKTVDGGEKRFMYNKRGQVSAVQDQIDRENKNAQNQPRPRYRRFTYDDFGRPTGQHLVTMHYHLDPFVYETKSWGDANGNYIDPQGLPHYLRYTFTNRMTQDWLVKFITLDPVNGAQVTITELPTGGFAGNVLAVLEKDMIYGVSQAVPTKLGKLVESGSYNLSGVRVQRITYDYNNLDQLTTQVIRQHPTNEALNDSKLVKATISYSAYNYRGSLLEEKVDMGSDGTVDMKYFYTYDRLNRLTNVHAAQSDVLVTAATLMASYFYDDARGVVNLTKYSIDNTANSSVQFTTVQNFFDDRDRLIKIQSELMDYRLYYDNNTVPSFQAVTVQQSFNHNGNINGIQVSYQFQNATNSAQLASLFSYDTKYGYKYDQANRLIQADAIVGDYVMAQAGATTAYRIGDESMTYDRIGNLTTLLRVKPGAQMNTGFLTDDFVYQYTAGNNRLSLVDGQNGTVDRAYTYDANGNLMTDNFKGISASLYGRGAYTYNLTKGSETISYLYDAGDMRFYKKVVAAAQTTEEMYVKDALGRDLAIVRFTTTGGTTTSSTEYYVFGNERLARVTTISGGTPGRIYPAEATYFLQDHLGNTRVSFMYSGNASAPFTIVNAMDYYPYGKILREYDGGEGDRYLTTNHERDKETGLDYRGARYYDSDVAKFLSIDPWQAKYPQWSTYNYVMGNPIMLIDPTGKGPDDPDKQKKVRLVGGEKITMSKAEKVVKFKDWDGNGVIGFSNGVEFQGVNRNTVMSFTQDGVEFLARFNESGEFKGYYGSDGSVFVADVVVRNRKNGSMSFAGGEDYHYAPFSHVSLYVEGGLQWGENGFLVNAQMEDHGGESMRNTVTSSSLTRISGIAPLAKMGAEGGLDFKFHRSFGARNHFHQTEFSIGYRFFSLTYYYNDKGENGFKLAGGVSTKSILPFSFTSCYVTEN